MACNAQNHSYFCRVLAEDSEHWIYLKVLVEFGVFQWILYRLLRAILVPGISVLQFYSWNVNGSR